MDLREHLRLLRRNLALVAILPVVGLAVGVAYTAVQTPLYESTSSVYVATEQAQTASDLSLGSTYTQQVVKSYAQLVGQPIILDKVRSKTGVDLSTAKLADMITAEAPLNTAILNITVTDTSPERAATLANATAAALQAEAPKLSPDNAKSNPSIKVTITQPAAVPGAPVSPRVALNLALGLIAGLALAIGVSYLRAAFDTKVRNVEDLRLATDKPLLGVIALDKTAKKYALTTASDRRGMVAETYRSFRTNLQFLPMTGTSRAFVVTSAVAAEGKSTTAGNLAIVLAEAGRKVLLIDGDLRKPKLHDYFAIDGSFGLADLLADIATDDQVIQHWGENGLAVLPAGTIPPNPNELLQSPRMIALLARMRERYDVVIIDAPPLLPVSDAAVVARQADGAILVVAAQKTRRDFVTTALQRLEQVEATTLGIVLTQVPSTGADAYRYGHYAYEGHSTGSDSRPHEVQEPKTDEIVERVPAAEPKSEPGMAPVVSGGEVSGRQPLPEPFH